MVDSSPYHFDCLLQWKILVLQVGEMENQLLSRLIPSQYYTDLLVVAIPNAALEGFRWSSTGYTLVEHDEVVDDKDEDRWLYDYEKSYATPAYPPEYLNIIDKINKYIGPQHKHEVHQFMFAVELTFPYSEWRKAHSHPQGMKGPHLDCCDSFDPPESGKKSRVRRSSWDDGWTPKSIESQNGRRSILMLESATLFEIYRLRMNGLHKTNPYFAISQPSISRLVVAVSDVRDIALLNGPNPSSKTWETDDVLVKLELHTSHNTITLPFVLLGVLVWNAGPTMWCVGMDLRKNLIALRRRYISDRVIRDARKLFLPHWKWEKQELGRYKETETLIQEEVNYVPLFDDHDCVAVLLEGAAEHLVSLENPFEDVVYGDEVHIEQRPPWERDDPISLDEIHHLQRLHNREEAEKAHDEAVLTKNDEVARKKRQELKAKGIHILENVNRWESYEWKD